MADDSSFWDSVADVGKAALAVAAAYALQDAVQGIGGGKSKTSSQIPSEDTVMAAIKFAGDFSRTAGAVTFRQAQSNAYVTVQAASLGRLDGIAAYYLNDDKVTLDVNGAVIAVTNGGTTITSGRYLDSPDKRVIFHTRMGLPTETAYSEVVTRFPSIYGSTYRGDGIGSFCVERFAPAAKFVDKIFPSGPPEASIATRGVCYDWRKDDTVTGGSGDQRRDDPTTWEASDNPLVWDVFREWHDWGMDWDTEITPSLDLLTDGANFNEGLIDLNAGGTEKRYRCAFNYPDDENQDATRQRFKDAMDAFWMVNGLGHLIVKPGQYEEPTFVITADDICAPDGDVGYSWSRGTANANAVDLVNVTFMSPDNDYLDMQCDPWIISDQGNRATSLNLGVDGPGVFTFTQARRLAKRKAARLMPTYRGWVRVGLMGRRGLGERYIRIQNPRLNSMSDVVCEVTNVEFDPDTLTFVFTVISADTNIDAWNPATEEGAPVNVIAGVNPEALSAPTITSATAVYTQFSDNTTGVSIVFEADSGTNRSDLTWYPSWKLSTGTVYNDLAAQAGNGDGTANLTIPGPLPVNATINIRVEAITNTGSPSGWSAAQNVSTSRAAVAPSPDSITSYSGGAGTYTVAWTNSTSSNFAGSRLWRVPTGDPLDYGSATDDTGLRTGAAGTPDSASPTGITAGTWDIYVTAENASGAKSATGPVTVTIS
jgi:hypothetical protein